VATRRSARSVVRLAIQLINQAAEALLWLTRGLSFTAQALRRHVDNPSEELNVSFSKAYDATLSKQHGFVVRGIFSVSFL